MYISNDEIQILEQGLSELTSKPYQTRSKAKRMKSFNELYAENCAKQPSVSEIYAQNVSQQHSYEEDQKRGEQLWLKQRAQSYSTKGYETKLIGRPYVSFTFK